MTKLKIMKEYGIPLLVGQCTKCKNGEHSLIIVKYVLNMKNDKSNTIQTKCISCSKTHYHLMSEID